MSELKTAEFHLGIEQVIANLRIGWATFDEGDKKIKAILNEATENAVKHGMELAAGIVHNEPNLPGEMPNEFFKELQTKAMATNTFRSTVSVTMDNIKSRILTLATNYKLPTEGERNDK